MPKFILGWLVCLVCLLPVVSSAQEKPLVYFANPGYQDDSFFGLMTDFMLAAADDLGFELKVFYGERNHVLIDENIRTIYKGDRRPDYVIGMDARGSGAVMLAMGEEQGIKTIFVNQSFLHKERTRMGMPGQNYKNWLFEYLPDDVHAGYILGKKLIQSAVDRKLFDNDGSVVIAAISGHDQSAASILRMQGVRKAVAEFPQARLVQSVSAGWRRDKAHNLALRLMDRYPELSVCWAASDLIAMGAVDAMGERGKVPGKDIIVGGVDWSNVALPLIRDGRLAGSAGGHFMDGGFALVMLYDLIHGVAVSPLSRSRFSLLTRENVDDYINHFGTNDWGQIDFRKFSKVLNPEVKEYDFSLKAVLEQVR
ncbi:ABC transporter substrate-binding protein [Pseudodesulfovibrio sp. zrk46]|uniref:ABC transporter substrate-binding protein n=1 Tax=Pseudodesulfovibrio sp. zrk46 TaxID=2725288 RepID=UPI001448CA49|nr:ABC transporter substrate-binding protein [Pseudodesulfovibrio sp. zrk46]QJB56199.1 substrate-binding domain-containing protein [Pseudodesulfovibrio sp. zrk46]